MVDPADLYGRGFAFPPRVGPDGRVAWSEGEPNVRESICIILRTRPGERVMRPDFGCGIDRYLFEPANIATLRLIQEEVKVALVRWEPRIRLDDIVVATNPGDPRAVDISIYYTLIASSARERLNMTVALQA